MRSPGWSARLRHRILLAMHTPAPEEEYAELERGISELHALRAGLGERVTGRVESISAWGVDQHLYHIALATDFAIRNVVGIVAEKHPLLQHEGTSNELTAELLRRRSFPRGETQSPRIVTPPSEVDLEFLATEMQGNLDRLPQLKEALPNIGAATGRVKHQALGPLSAREWLTFANLHVQHHLVIAREIAEAL